MRLLGVPPVSAVVVVLVLVLSIVLALRYREPTDSVKMATLGGVHESQEEASALNSAEVDGLARFAVDEHNKKENAVLEFARVVKAQEQVVAGTLHHLTLEAIDAGKKKIYEAKVWVKPWMNFKELQEFKHADAGDSSSPFTTSDLGGKKGGHGPGWQAVPCHHLIPKFRTQQTMLSRPSSRGLTHCFLMNFKRSFMQRQR